MGAVAAERIKLSTTRSTLWCSALTLATGVVLGALNGGSASVFAAQTPGRAAGLTVQIGVPILMVLAAITVTNENRTGMVRTTFQAVPRRVTVVGAKALVVGVWSAGVAFVTALASVLAVRATAGPVAASALTLGNGAVWTTVSAVALYAGLSAVFAVAVGVLLRHTAGAVAFLLLWPTMIELVLGWLTDIGKSIQPFLPFANGIRFTGVPSYTVDGVAFVWNRTGSLIYFATVVAVVLGAAVIAVARRDV